MLRTIAMAISLMVAVAVPTQAQSAEQKNQIRTSGTARVDAPINSATIRAGVATSAATADTAVAENNAVMRRVIDAVVEFGVPRVNIQTSGFGIYERYDNDGQPNGFRVSNSVRIKTDNVGTVGQLLDVVVRNGANRVGGVTLTTEADSDLSDEALALAFADAQRKAQVLAQTASVTLGAPLRIDEQVRSSSSYSASFSSLAADTVPIEPGQGGVTATVQVVYEIQ